MIVGTRRIVAGAIGAAAAITLVSPALPASAQEHELFITSAVAVNTTAGTVTLPLHHGTSSGRSI